MVIRPLPEAAERERNEARLTQPRMDWVDVAKGWGMILVILGHTAALMGSPLHAIVYWFHMPVFFFMSGVLLKPPASLRGAIVRRTKQLMVPYFCYLLILEAPRYYHAFKDPSRLAGLRMILLDFVWGGERLRGATIIFWFPPVLLLACVVGYWALNRPGSRRVLWAFGAAVAVSTVQAAYYASLKARWDVGGLPFDLWVVPYASAFLLAGHLFRRLPKPGQAWSALSGGLVFLGIVAAELVGRVAFSVDLKHGIMGPPGLGFAAALAGTFCTILVSKATALWKPARAGFGYLGRRSMTVMYLHGPVVIAIGWKTPSVLAALAGGVFIPLGLDALFARYKLTRELLLPR